MVLAHDLVSPMSLIPLRVIASPVLVVATLYVGPDEFILFNCDGACVAEDVEGEEDIEGVSVIILGIELGNDVGDRLPDTEGNDVGFKVVGEALGSCVGVFVGDDCNSSQDRRS